jgi:hypothetical protein
MPTALELFHMGRLDEIWKMCCGFISLDLDQFMNIQKRLLLEQLGLLNNCDLGKKIMLDNRPATVEEFRQQVPLTTYSDYCPELLEKQEDVLPALPAHWIRTSGKSGEYPCKWVPLTREYSRIMSEIMYGIGVFSACNGWGDTSHIDGHPKIVYTVAPRPYTSGIMVSLMEQQTRLQYLPPLEEVEKMSFEERIKIGFQQALSEGLDYFFGLSMVLVTVGEKFSRSSDSSAITSLLSRPKALFRLTRGKIKSRLAGRAMLPRDLWKIKGIMTGGLDSGVYREKIKEFWGRYPLDVYTGTEIGIVATQTWDYQGMTFVPNLNFLEFIPETEHIKWQLDRSYRPETVLLDEVKPGERYEIVVTSFHGGAMIRYRPGDMIEITSLRNENLGIEIPQMLFVGRADHIVDFGVTRLTEKVIWQAVENTGIPYEDWVAQKEVGEGMTLRLYIEPKEGASLNESEVEMAISEQLKCLDDSFVATSSDVGGYLDFNLAVTILQNGTFSRYIEHQRTNGAELAHLKPPHMNPSERVMSMLLSGSEHSGVDSDTKMVAAT